MKMFKLILALSCVVVFCESNMLRRDDACDQLKRCILPVRSLQFYYNEGVYEQFCQAEATFKNCVEDFRPQCNDDSATRGAESQVAAVEFICSTEGSQVIHAAIQSDCITNATKKLEIENVIDYCIIAATMNAFTNGEAPEEDAYCPYLEQALTCVTTYINENCGAIYGAFLRELFQRAARPLLSCELVARHARRFVDAI